MTAKQMAVNTIIGALNTGDEVVRCSAAKALGVIGDKQAVEALADHVMDADIDVAMDAIEALGLVGDQTPVPLLIEGLNLADDADLRVNAADAIGRLGGEGAVEALIQALTLDMDAVDQDGWDVSWDINMMAVDGLGRIGDERAVEPMLAMLEDENAIDDEARIIASICLCGEKGIHAVVKRLNEHTNTRSRRRCAMALGDIDSDLARDALADALLDEDADVRLYAARALAKSSNSAYLLPLLMLLKDPHAEVRAEAVQLAAQLGGERASEKIRPLLKDESHDVQKAACKVLGEAGDVASVEPLLALLEQGDQELRTAAVDALGLIADESSRSALLAVLTNQREEELLRAAVPAALLNKVNEDVLVALREAVGDDEQAVRGMAMMALKEINTAQAQEILFAALRGELLAEPEEAEVDESVAEEDADAGETVADGDEQAVEGDEADMEEPVADASEADAADAPEGDAIEMEEEEWTGTTLDVVAEDNAEALSFAEHINEDFTLPEALSEYVDMADRNSKRADEGKKKGKQIAVAPHQDVRMFAARALADCDHDVVNEALLACLSDNEEQELRKDILRSLGKLGKQQTAQALLPLLSDNDRDIRFEVVRALAGIGSDEARDALLEKLDDEDFFVRLAVIEAMQKFSGDRIIDALREHLSDDAMLEHLAYDSRIRIRLACARALASLGDASALSDVVAATFMDNGDQRIEIGRLLRQFEPEAATGELIGVLEDEAKVDNHRAAVEALQEIYRVAV